MVKQLDKQDCLAIIEPYQDETWDSDMKSNAKMSYDGGNDVSPWAMTATLPNGDVISGFGVTPAAAVGAFKTATSMPKRRQNDQYKWRVKAGSDLSMVADCIAHARVTGSIGDRATVSEYVDGRLVAVRWCEVNREPKSE